MDHSAQVSSCCRLDCLASFHLSAGQCARRAAGRERIPGHKLQACAGLHSGGAVASSRNRSWLPLCITRKTGFIAAVLFCLVRDLSCPPHPFQGLLIPCCVAGLGAAWLPRPRSRPGQRDATWCRQPGRLLQQLLPSPQRLRLLRPCMAPPAWLPTDARICMLPERTTLVRIVALYAWRL